MFVQDCGLCCVCLLYESTTGNTILENDDVQTELLFLTALPMVSVETRFKLVSKAQEQTRRRDSSETYTQSTLECMWTSRQTSGHSPSVHFRASVRYSSRLPKPTVTQALALGNCRHALRRHLR
jgi:hypothetical protein